MNIRQFLKPDWRKTTPTAFILMVVFLGFLIPSLEEFVLNSPFQILYYPFMVTAGVVLIGLLGGPEGLNAISHYVTAILSFVTLTLFWYCLFSLLVSSYDKLKKKFNQDRF